MFKPWDEIKHKVYTESDWLPESGEDCERAERENDVNKQNIWYVVSKKEAEKAAFEIQEKTGKTFSLGTILPTGRSTQSLPHVISFRLLSTPWIPLERERKALEEELLMSRSQISHLWTGPPFLTSKD